MNKLLPQSVSVNLSQIGHGIDVQQNFLQFFSEKINTLDITHNGIKSLPKMAFNKASLKYLHFWRGNSIRNLFSGIFLGLDNITCMDSSISGTIDLSRRFLENPLYENFSLRLHSKFLEGIGPEIDSLILTNNHIQTLPEDAFNYNFSHRLLSLEFMDGNFIRDLPANAFRGLSSIQRINSDIKGVFNLSGASILNLQSIF